MEKEMGNSLAWSGWPTHETCNKSIQSRTPPINQEHGERRPTGAANEERQEEEEREEEGRGLYRAANGGNEGGEARERGR